MENNQGEKMGCGGGMGMCGCKNVCGACGHNHMHIVKTLVKLIIIVLVFSFGVKFGELKGMIESHGEYFGKSYRGGMMYGTDYYPAQGGIDTGPSAPAQQ